MGIGAASILGLMALGLAACSFDIGGLAFVNDKTVVARAGVEEPVLGPDGRCTGDASFDPSLVRRRAPTIESGMSECDLVRLKGQPTDVLIGGSGKGEREVQVLYQEPTGKKLYLFIDNRLTRMVE